MIWSHLNEALPIRMSSVSVGVANVTNENEDMTATPRRKWDAMTMANEGRARY
jgi:hypothetical protein